MVCAFSVLTAVNFAVASGEETEEGQWLCGVYGKNLECPTYATGMCASQKDPNCSYKNNCGGDTWAAVECSLDDTDVNKGASAWKYGTYGAHLSCVGSSEGTAATGICGSGEAADCDGGQWHFGIDCAVNGVKVLAETCEWTYHQEGPTYYECPPERPILAGACGSGLDPNCNGHTFATQCCAEHATVENVVGQWTPIARSSGTQTISYSLGTTLSHTHSQTETVGHSIQQSAAAHLSVLGEGGQVSVSTTESQSLATTDTTSFSTTLTGGYQTTLPAGTVWQWKYTSKLNRGSAVTMGLSLAATSGDGFPPCCLPGRAIDPTNYTGVCETGSVDLCGRGASLV